MPYPDMPGFRMAYDRDGTVGFLIDDDTNTIAPMPASYLRLLNNEEADAINSDYAGNHGGRIGLIFPELKDIVGYFVAEASSISWDTFQTSVDTTNGLDGTWVTRVAGSVPSSSSVSTGYRDAIQSVSWTGIKAVRMRGGDFFDNVEIKAWHFFGAPAAGTSATRLRLWHPTLNQEIDANWFNYDDVGQGSSDSITFRIKNTAATTANAVRVGVDELTHPTPNMIGRFSFLGSAGVTAMLYRNIVLASTPDLYWVLDDAPGATTIADASGHSATGTMVGTPSPGFGQTAVVAGDGTSLGLDGDNTKYVNRAYEAGFDVGTGDFTLEAVLYLTGPAGDYSQLLGRDNGTGNGIALYTHYGGKVLVYVGGTLFVGASIQVKDSTLHHVVIRRRLGSVQIFVDGLVDAGGDAAGSTNTTSPFRVGTTSQSYAGIFGRVGHVAYYKKALDDGTIMRHAAQALVYTNTSYSAMASITTLGAGVISNVITMRRQEPANASLGLWAARVVASADYWS